MKDEKIYRGDIYLANLIKNITIIFLRIRVRSRAENAL